MADPTNNPGTEVKNAPQNRPAEVAWTNPVVIGLLAAAIGLAGNLAVALINARTNQDLERYKARATLISEIVKTGNRDQALTNLKFFVDNGLLEDPDGALHRALKNKDAIPVLPSATSSIYTERCYTLANATNHEVMVKFAYPPGEVPVNAVTSTTFLPNGKQRYCLSVGSVTANIATPHSIWEGNRAMVMGNAQGALPAGTYRMVDGK